MPDRKPVAHIQQRGARTWGPYAWQAWVTAGLTRYDGEFGTYAWTERAARRKAARLLRRYLASMPGPVIDVESEDA